MSAGETARHLELKRLALAWAQTQGYSIAAVEVSVPNLRCRIDVAAYRPARDGREPRLGVTAIFECKQCRPDFLKDSRRATLLTSRLERLHLRKSRHEAALKLWYPSLRNGDSLFAEYESHDFARSGDEVYLKLLAQLRTASRQLHEQTKFEKLARWKVANLRYVVSEPGICRQHELPDGWGLLLRAGSELELSVKPVWQELAESSRLTLLHRIALAGTRAVNREVQSSRDIPVADRRDCDRNVAATFTHGPTRTL